MSQVVSANLAIKIFTAIMNKAFNYFFGLGFNNGYQNNSTNYMLV